MNKYNNFSLYDNFFSTPESEQYVDLQKRFDDDFQRNVIYECHDFSKEGWFRSTVAAALNNYLIYNSELGLDNDKK